MADKPTENLYDLLNNNSNRIYVIAEAGVNHGGSKEKALALVRAAKWAGADAVKFQTFKADRLASTRPATLSHTKNQPNLQELFKKLELPYDTFRALHKEAVRIGIDFLSTPFDEESADFLDELGVQAFKIASGDITHRPLIEHVSRKGKPVLLSTGMSTAEEIEKAIDWMHTQSNAQVILLHCVSSYPAKAEELNLKSVQYLKDRFGVPIGFSDHSVGSLGSVVAVSLGAQIIERHFMIETRGDTPDVAVSMDAKQLKLHIEELRTVGTILGERGKFASEGETRNKTASRRALYARRPIAAGETIDAGMLYALRPAVGISPEFVDSVVGKHAVTAIEADAPVQWEWLA
ncbi:MAG: N-acetylneuraminate synthase family protein [Acidobacteria bacterium]|nr:N-acetylneuraminate synthase family protein [Acidobacteriota bacterium]